MDEEHYDEAELYYEEPYLSYICAGCEFFFDEGRCEKYKGFPLDFFGRKKQCKHFKEYIWNECE